MSKRSGPLDFKGSTQEKSASEIFRFGYRKAANDKKVPDRVGSGGFVIQKLFVRPIVRSKAFSRRIIESCPNGTIIVIIMNLCNFRFGKKTIADAALWNRRDSQHCMLSEAQPQSPALYIGQDQLVTFRPFCYE